MAHVEPSRLTIPQYFSGIANKLKNQTTSLTPISRHSGDKGDNDHAVFAEILRDYLPTRIGIDNGYVINSLSDIAETDPNHAKYKIGPSSDILLGDYLENSPLSTEKAFKVLPIEMVLGTIEVTRYLDSTKLADDLDKLARVRRLAEVKEYYPNGLETGADRLRPRAYVVGFESAISENEIIKQFMNIDDDLRPNAILLLDRALYVREPYKTRVVRVETDQLFHFISLLKLQIESFPLGRANLSKYLPVGGWIIDGKPGQLSSSSASALEFEHYKEASSSGSGDE